MPCLCFTKKKRREKEIESGQQRLDHKTPTSRALFPHTSPHCISDTGRHFSALHIYKWTYVWICIVLYVSCGKQALLRASISGLRLFVCHCQCSTCNVLVSAGPGSLYNLSSAYTHTHIPMHTHAHIHPMSVGYSSCCNRWQMSSGQLLISQFVFAFNISIQCKSERERESEIRNNMSVLLAFVIFCTLRVLFF